MRWALLALIGAAAYLFAVTFDLPALRMLCKPLPVLAMLLWILGSPADGYRRWVAVGLVLSVTLKSIRTGVRGLGPIGVLLGVFIAIGVLQWPLVPVVAVLAPISVIIAWYSTRTTAKEPKAESDA